MVYRQLCDCVHTDGVAIGGGFLDGEECDGPPAGWPALVERGEGGWFH